MYEVYGGADVQKNTSLYLTLPLLKLAILPLFLKFVDDFGCRFSIPQHGIVYRIVITGGAGSQRGLIDNLPRLFVDKLIVGSKIS